MQFLRLLSLLVAGTALCNESRAQCELQTFRAPAGSLGGFGWFLAQDGRHFAVASDRSVHVYEQVGRTAFREAELPLFTDSSWIDSIALDGDWLAIGASPIAELEAVRVFERRAGTWTEVQRLESTQLSEGFGHAVAIEGDRLYVGAPMHDSPGIANTGVVYVYALAGGVWVELERIVPLGARVNERFGYALDVEGGRLAVAAPLAFSNRQSVYVLERSGGGWLQSILTPANSVTASLGEALDLRGDALLVGDPSARGGGRAWAFERGASGWSESGELVPDPADAAFGLAGSVMLSDDGRRAWLGSPYADDPVHGSGVVHVFEKGAAGWQRIEKRYPVNPGTFRGFGRALSCAGDLTLVLGGGLVSSYSQGELLCRTLFSQPTEISLAQGGRCTLRLNPGSRHAGRTYLLLGSASGFEPGVRLGRQRLPLEPDAYFTSGLPGSVRPPFVNNLGVLGASTPQATVTIDVPPGLGPALIGRTLYHAFLVIDHGIVDVSNVRELRLVP